MVEEDLTVHLDRRLQGVEWQTRHMVALLLERLQVLEEFMRTLATISSLVKRIEQELLSHRISCKIMTTSKNSSHAARPDYLSIMSVRRIIHRIAKL